MDNILKAHQLDKQNTSVLYHLALIYAHLRDVRKAFAAVKQAIQQMYEQDDNSAILHDAYVLLTLLFTSEKDYANALKSIKLGKAEYNHSIAMQFMTRKMDDMCKEHGLTPKQQQQQEEASNNDTKSASISWEKLLATWTDMLRAKYAAQEQAAASATSPSNTSANNPLQSNPNITITTPAASTTDASAPTQQANTTALPALKSKEGLYKLETYHVWVAEALRKTGEVNKAMQLCRSMTELFKKESMVSSANLLYMTGYLNEEAKRLDAALSDYESALLRDAHHKQALLRMGMLQWKHCKQITVAKSYVQSALRVDAHYHEAWHVLGMLMRETENLDDASDCFMTALKLEKTAPIVPFEQLVKFHV